MYYIFYVICFRELFAKRFCTLSVGVLSVIGEEAAGDPAPTLFLGDDNWLKDGPASTEIKDIIANSQSFFELCMVYKVKYNITTASINLHAYQYPDFL